MTTTTSDATYAKNNLALIKYIEGGSRDPKGLVDYAPRPMLLPAEKSEISTLFGASFYTQASLADYKARKNIIRRVGLSSASISQMITELMGEPHTEQKTIRKRHNHNWVCFHLSEQEHPLSDGDYRFKVLEGGSCTWGAKVERYRKKTLGKLPFQRIIHWELWDSQLSQLKTPISQDHAGMISVIKRMRLFSAFGILAHPDAFQKTTATPYLIYGELWNCLLTSDKKLENKLNASLRYPIIVSR